MRNNKYRPRIKITPPGPKAKEVLKKDKKFISPSYTRVYPLVIAEGNDVLVKDADGNLYLDLTAGVATCITGHSHPEIVKAIISQVQKFIHMSGTDFYYDVAVKLAEKLTKITPGNFEKMVFFTNSGAESVEAAIKLARWFTRKPKIIAFYGAFHGRTLGALSLTASKPVHRRYFAPLLPEVVHTPYPYCYRCPLGNAYPDCGIACFKFLKEQIFGRLTSPEEVAAIIFEPIQGEGGYIVPPKEFVEALYSFTKESKILLIADEVQSGIGRTGKMFACEHFGIEPDIICVAKGIASGLPLGATISRAELNKWQAGAHASTFGGNPVACVSALKTIEFVENSLLKNAYNVGKFLYSQLKELERNIEQIGDVRGLGLMLGVEFIENKISKNKNPNLRNEITQQCFQNGLLLLPCGENIIRFCPALTITQDAVSIALEIFSSVINKLVKKPSTIKT